MRINQENIDIESSNTESNGGLSRRSFVIGAVATTVAGLTGCSGETADEVVENNAPKILEISGTTEILEGEKLKLEANIEDKDGDKIDYFWMIVDENNNIVYESDDLNSNTLEFDGLENAGKYTVILTVEDGKGGNDSSHVEITVSEAPVEIVDASTTIGTPSVISKTDTTITVEPGEFTDPDGVQNVVVVCSLNDSEATSETGEFTNLEPETEYEIFMRGEAYNPETGEWEVKEGNKIAVTTDETPNEVSDTITEENQENINLEDNGVNPSFDINIDDSVDPNDVNLHFEYIYVHDGDEEETYAEDMTLAGAVTGDRIDLNGEGKLYVLVTQNGNTYHVEFYNEDSGRLSAIKQVDVGIKDSNNDDNVHFEK